MTKAELIALLKNYPDNAIVAMKHPRRKQVVREIRSVYSDFVRSEGRAWVVSDGAAQKCLVMSEQTIAMWPIDRRACYETPNGRQ